MNDSGPKRRRRRRGGGKKSTAEKVVQPQPAAASKPKSKESGRRKSGPRKPQSGKQPAAPPMERLSAEETLEMMIREFPPAYSKLTLFIQLCRKLRNKSEVHSPLEFFYFLATSIETLAEEKFDDLFYSKYAEPLKEIRVSAGLKEDEFWKKGDPATPEVYTELLEEFRAEKRQILSKMFRNFGETDTATLIEEEYEEYVKQRDEGREEFYSRHSFEAVRMTHAEMNPQTWSETDEEIEPESFEDFFEEEVDEEGEEE